MIAFNKVNAKFRTMKLFSHYQTLKKKSIELLSKGILDEYFEILIQLSQLEKQLVTLSRLN